MIFQITPKYASKKWATVGVKLCLAICKMLFWIYCISFPLTVVCEFALDRNLPSSACYFVAGRCFLVSCCSVSQVPGGRNRLLTVRAPVFRTHSGCLQTCPSGISEHRRNLALPPPVQTVSLWKRKDGWHNLLSPRWQFLVRMVPYNNRDQHENRKPKFNNMHV